jgi:hypothetical protein
MRGKIREIFEGVKGSKLGKRPFPIKILNGFIIKCAVISRRFFPLPQVSQGRCDKRSLFHPLKNQIAFHIQYTYQKTYVIVLKIIFALVRQLLVLLIGPLFTSVVVDI